MPTLATSIDGAIFLPRLRSTLLSLTISVQSPKTRHALTDILMDVLGNIGQCYILLCLLGMEYLRFESNFIMFLKATALIPPIKTCHSNCLPGTSILCRYGYHFIVASKECINGLRLEPVFESTPPW